MDEFKSFFDRCHINREMFTGIVITVSFLVALSCVTPVTKTIMLASDRNHENKLSKDINYEMTNQITFLF